MAATEQLFTPHTTGALQLPNRMMMAAMTRSRAGAGNVPTALTAKYYRQRASAGLIVTEASQVVPEGVGYPNTPGIHSKAQVEGWRQVTRTVHAAGGRIFLQLWHVGRISHPSMQPDGKLPVAPSAIAPRGEVHTSAGLQPFVTPRALEIGEIPGIVAQFAEGARRAKEAGFDGVEIHAANGYLVDQFIRDGSNQRTDVYGGSIKNRLRFLREVTEAVVGVWGPGRVGVRLSPAAPFNDMADSDPLATFTAAARMLDRIDLAYLHVIEPVTAAQPTLASIRAAYRGTLVVNGGYDAKSAEDALVRGEADLVAFGSLFLANPDLGERFRLGAPLNQPDRATFYGGDARGYTDYPAYMPADESPAAA